MVDDFADVPLPSDIPFQYRQSVLNEAREKKFVKMIIASSVEVYEIGSMSRRQGRSYINWVVVGK